MARSLSGRTHLKLARFDGTRARDTLLCQDSGYGSFSKWWTPFSLGMTADWCHMLQVASQECHHVHLSNQMLHHSFFVTKTAESDSTAKQLRTGFGINVMPRDAPGEALLPIQHVKQPNFTAEKTKGPPRQDSQSILCESDRRVLIQPFWGHLMPPLAAKS